MGIFTRDAAILRASFHIVIEFLTLPDCTLTLDCGFSRVASYLFDLPERSSTAKRCRNCCFSFLSCRPFLNSAPARLLAEDDTEPDILGSIRKDITQDREIKISLKAI